jgi:hypothetical protein
MGSLCFWTVSLVVGLGLCAPDRAVAMGLPGTFLGGWWFDAMGWPAGPLFFGYPMLPGLVGTTLMLILVAFAKQLYDDLASPKQGLIPPVRRAQFMEPPVSPREAGSEERSARRDQAGSP